jgi:hypothetical protein
MVVTVTFEGEDGKELKEATVEAIKEEVQEKADDSDVVAHTKKQAKVLVS